ncbi:uncharacterized protein LOC116336800 [Contarinia nasturtii]|uniref:uncharacterized protein LOC116336800 n=1 Tax=Contarinia nasturtii TaxID=265458 RepID=UPI0012D3CC6F|nr:uncharacterized protein LOC116336800 [Contarinia nasturtii]
MNLKGAHSFFVLYFQRPKVHGFAYFGFRQLMFLEKIFWFTFLTAAYSATIKLSFRFLDRNQTRSTVLTIERDHYFWNITLSSLTICPVRNRIDSDLFEQYCKENDIGGRRVEFFAFMESLANASYESFDLIQHNNSIDSLNIDPEDYMMLIYNLTQNHVLKGDGDYQIQAYRDSDYIRIEQVLTEKGICYTTNNYTIGFKDDVIVSLIYVLYLIDVLNEYVLLKINRSTKIAQRHCRFNSESNLTHYTIYTEQLCVQECRLELVYSLCGCIPHFYPNRLLNPKPVCSWKILIPCYCLQNCVDSIIGITNIGRGTDQHALLRSNGGSVSMIEYPTLRYKRKVLFSTINLFISIGCTASFFTGFCVLGIIEIVHFFTIRLFWHVFGRKI